MELLKNGYIIVDYPYAQELRSLIITENYHRLDSILKDACKSNGELFLFLQQYYPFQFLEHIIAVRTAPDDDGIWHDDGSRLIGFSLSMNLSPENISGGALNIRKKGEEQFTSIAPLPFGKMVIFLTGQFGYEHKVDQVLSGKRTVVAGWGSDQLFDYN